MLHLHLFTILEILHGLPQPVFKHNQAQSELKPTNSDIGSDACIHWLDLTGLSSGLLLRKLN